jgi:Cation efflux family
VERSWSILPLRRRDDLSVAAAEDTIGLRRHGLRLEHVTLGWNVVGFVASLVVVWQLQEMQAVGRERRALQIIGVAFLLLAIYIGGQSIYVLVSEARPHHSLLGIAWLALTAIAMFALAAGKLATGRALGNRVLQTEARVTVIDGLMATAVLIGLILWADPAAAFVIVYYGLREGSHALRETRRGSRR